jgi:ATP/ADP translocase
MSFSSLHYHFSNKTIKNISLGLCFFFIIGAYTLLKELKDAIFIITVGTKYLPDAKLASLLLMIPMVLFYTWLSERVSRKKLLSFYAVLFGGGSLVISFFLKDPVIGIVNSIPDKGRLFGWITYLFLEGCYPFLVSLNWSFLNSISNPEDIKHNYIIMAAMGKVGSFAFGLFAWATLSHYFSFLQGISDIESYVILFRTSSFALFFIPFILLYLFLRLPQNEFQGYSDINDTKKEKN